MNPRFSIIVPLYNKANYVRKALESIVNQTFQDYEVIIVNDGSTDNSLDVAEKFFEHIDDRWIDDRCTSIDDRKIDNRWTIITQENAGVAVTRNNGVEKSKGEYVCFLDADDWWEPNFLEEMDRLIKEYPDAGLYATNFVYYKPGKTHVEHTNLKTGYINYPEVYARTGSMPVWTGAACMPRKVFDEMGGFPVGIKLGEDFLLWAKTALEYPVVFCEKPLAYYNNDVPASLRATRNLHAPQYHKLFNLAELENAINQLSNEEQKDLWHALLDKHRVQEMLDYWLSDEYHDIATIELSKVDWTKQPKSVVRQYKMPIWFLNIKRCFMQVGSYIKQKLIKTCPSNR